MDKKVRQVYMGFLLHKLQFKIINNKLCYARTRDHDHYQQWDMHTSNPTDLFVQKYIAFNHIPRQ